MIINSSIQSNYNNYKPTFRNSTTYTDKKVIENDLLSIYDSKEIFSNTLYPNSKVLGLKIQRNNSRNINLVSRYGNKVGDIDYNPDKPQPQINLQLGSFQPIIELKDEKLGITVLMTRGSKLSGDDLNINYKPLSNNISFGHKLVVTTGYKPENTEKVVEDYKANKKYDNLTMDYRSINSIKDDYTIVGLGGGFGTRLSPISDLMGENKPSTKYPGGEKSLMEVSILDKAYQLRDINSTAVLHDSNKSLLGTGGIVIKGLKDGTIPVDKPLILLTGDTFNNINLPQAVARFEKDKNCGMAMVVNKVDNVFDKSCVKFYKNDNEDTYPIESFSDLVNNDNKGSIQYSHYVYNRKTGKSEYYSTSNILMFKPEVLNILKDYASYDGSADMTDFLGLMFNVMNKPSENLRDKYSYGLSSYKLQISDLTYSDGTPKPIYSKNYDRLQLKAIIAEDMKDNNAVSEDVGTIESYIKVAHDIKNDKIPALDKSFTNSVKQNVSNTGVIYLGDYSNDRLEQFKSKYNIKSLEGNVIVHFDKKDNPTIVPGETDKSVSRSDNKLFEYTKTEADANKFITSVTINKAEGKKAFQTLSKQNGFKNFMDWYMASDGYYGAYEKYVGDLYKNANSIDELIKFCPNWAPWKLEQKSWLLNHPEYKNYSEDYQKLSFERMNNYQREQEFSIGYLPYSFNSSDDFNNLVSRLKRETPDRANWDIGYRSFDIKKLKGGELNDKFVYLLENRYDKKYILKFDRTNVEDANNVDYRDLSLYEKKILRKNKYLAPDSIYSGACLSKYLELNGCDSVPKLYYYNHKSNAALYEFIEDADNDKFQQDELGDEYQDILEANKCYKSLNDLGVYLNDTAYKNVLTDKQGNKKVIDLGHSNFMMPFKPGVKFFNIEFANTNGPDLANIYGSLLSCLD